MKKLIGKILIILLVVGMLGTMIIIPAMTLGR